MNKIKGKRVAITGGTRGIGRAVAERLLAEGARVAVCGRSEDGVKRAVAELSSLGHAVGIAADVANPEDVARFFRYIDEQLLGLDVLVNNAGLGVFKPTADLTVEEWQQTIDVNLSGTFYCSREAIGRFRASGGAFGYVINISSLAGKNPFAGGAAYNASKFGMNGLSEAMMLDHRHDNVKVSYVMPGSVATEFASGGGGDWKIAPEDIAEIVSMLLRMPDRTLVSRVEVRPARPRKGA